MKVSHSLACALLLALALAGCNRSTVHVNGNSVLQHITIQAGRVGANAPDGTTAWIDAAGALTINGKDVDLNAEQRLLTTSYYTTATGIRSDGVAVGKAGAAVAGKAVSSVIQGLASGKPDDIGPRIEAEAKNVEDKAMLLCRRVGELQATQDALAASLPAFVPYATIKGNEFDDCCGGASQTRTQAGPDQGASMPSEGTLIAAVDAGDLNAVRRLIEQGADANARVPGDGTALIRAARRGDLAIVEELLRLGADAKQSSRGDGNPLIAAAAAGSKDVVERLIAAGADVDAIVAGDETPLINAARHGHLDIVQLLVDAGADVNLGVTADFGKWRSPLNQARGDAVRDYLLSRGAVAKRSS